MYICIYVYMYMCICVYVYMYMYICICIYVYVYIYISNIQYVLTRGIVKHRSAQTHLLGTPMTMETPISGNLHIFFISWFLNP